MLQPEQFKEGEWPAVHKALQNVPRMFQLWACKQVNGVAGTNEMQVRYTPNHSRQCSSCSVRVETYVHMLFCEESGRVDLLHKSVELVHKWLKEEGTDEQL